MNNTYNVIIQFSLLQEADFVKKKIITDDHIINHKQMQCVTHFYLFYFAFFLCVFFSLGWVIFFWRGVAILGFSQ